MRCFIRTKIVNCQNAGIKIPKLCLYTDKQQFVARNSRAKHCRTTLPAVKKMNEKYSRDMFEAIVINNFTDGDYMLTLTFPYLYTDKQRDLELKAFINRLRRRFNKIKKELCYVYVSEYGNKDGHLHFHMLINNGLNFDEIKAVWNSSRTPAELKGNCNIQRLETDENGLLCLAYYLQKQWQLGTPNKRKWNCSRNIKRPEISVNDDEVSDKDFNALCSATCPADIKKVIEKLYNGYQLISFDMGHNVHLNDFTGGCSVKLILTSQTKEDKNCYRPLAPLVLDEHSVLTPTSSVKSSTDNKSNIDNLKSDLLTQFSLTIFDEKGVQFGKKMTEVDFGYDVQKAIDLANFYERQDVWKGFTVQRINVPLA